MYLKYLKYLIIHKYVVALECFKRGLFWRGIIHDISKFKISDFVTCSRFFNNLRKYSKANDYYYRLSVCRHYNSNDHHWQSFIWISERGIKIFDMPEKSRIEMVCDWIGANKARSIINDENITGKHKSTNICQWWDEHKHKIILHTNTRKWVEDFMNREETKIVINKGKIMKIFGTKHCAACIKIKQLLDNKKRSYEFLDIEDPENLAELASLELADETMVPIIVSNTGKKLDFDTVVKELSK